MIDILVIIIMLLAFYFGYRRGFIVSLVRLILLYLATLFAPSVAEPLGAIFLDNKFLAFVAGFFLSIRFRRSSPVLPSAIHPPPRGRV